MIGGTVALLIISVIAAIVLTTDDQGQREEGSSEPAAASEGLPETSDYHSLLVAYDDPDEIYLGTHQGLFASSDGGASWRQTGAIEGDVMNLARDASNQDVLYAAGHQLFQKSTDGGETWKDIPLDDAIAETRASDGVKGVDIHGFAADPTQADTVYAAVANRGLYRSTDGGASFVKLSDTGAAGVAVTETDPRRIYLADARQGLLVSTDEAKSWKLLQLGVFSVAVAPDESHRVLAAGKAIYLSDDGESFRQVQAGPTNGFGRVAFAPSDASRAYAVGYDRVPYVSQDGGRTWNER